MKRKLGWFLLLLGMLAACRTTAQDAPTPVLSPTAGETIQPETVTPTPISAPVGAL